MPPPPAICLRDLTVCHGQRPAVHHLSGEFASGSLTAVVDQAMAQSAWVVFGFHGVGGDHTPVSKEDHEALLLVLDAREMDALLHEDKKVAERVQQNVDRHLAGK